MTDRGPIDVPRILLISTDLARAAHRCAQLTLAGWQTIQAVDTMEIFTTIRTDDVDLVLLQLPLAEAIGMDLPNVLRRVAPAAYLPVVILADCLGEQQRCQFLESGGDDVISEDTSPAEVIARLQALLRVKDLHDQLSTSRAALQAALQRERQLLAKLRRDNANLQTLASTDPLTRAQNVRSCHDILQHEFKIAKRYNQSLSLLVLDVDFFKLVNDTYGHPSGDHVLKELAAILRQTVRDSDVVARAGGEEFTVILPKADRADAAAFAERICCQVRSRRFNAYGREIHITISVGFASYPQDAEITEAEMLWYFADQALLTAKESGRDRIKAVHGFDPTLRRRLRRQFLHMRSTAGQARANWRITVQPHP